MPRLLKVLRLNRLAQRQIHGHGIEVGIFVEFIHQLAARQWHRQVFSAKLLEPPKRGVVVDAVVDSAAVEEGLRVVHRDRPLENVFLKLK